jgi:membrane protease subunit (stomatin/prohibitin family)
MAIIDVVKHQSNDNDLVFKFPSEDLKLGSQLIVSTSQTAFFVKGGKIYDQYESGTYTLSSDNIPLLNKLINLPFGSNSPFQAEVWYISLISKLDLKWGTASPIQLEDPKYGVIVPVRAYGQYGFKICNPRLFLETLVGNMSTFSSEKISEYFKGKILSSLASLISSKLVKDNVSILEINALLDEMSDFALKKLNIDFNKYGIELVNFNFISVNVPEEDPSIIKLKEAKDLAAKLRIIGRDVYQMDRSFDVLDKAAQNEGGVAGNIMGAGLGLGLGLGVGNQIGNIPSNLNTNLTQPPPPPSIIEFYFLINNQQNGPFDLNKMNELIINNTIKKETLVWKKGMTNWESAGTQIDLVNLFNYSNTTPPPPPPLI